MKKRFTKVLVLLALIAAMLAMMALPALATGETVTVSGVSGVSVSADSNGTATESNGTVTCTAKGGLLGKKTATFTVKNTSGSTAKITFDYSISKANSHSESADSGSKSMVLENNAGYAITITSNSGFSNTTATLTLSNFTITLVTGSSNVTVDYDSNLGSVTAAGAAVASGGVLEVPAEGVAVTATPASGATFLGWIDTADYSVLSTAASYTMMASEDMTVKAVFVNASSTAWFWASGTDYLFDDLNAASTFAKNASNKTLVLAANGTLPAGNYTVDSGVILLIPYNAANTLCTDTPTEVEDYVKPTAYRTLTMASGANVEVNGAISLSGQITGKYGKNSMPSGPISFVKMNTNSKITVNSGAKLYAWGFITGSGAVEIMSGGAAYECFQVADFRGGDGTTQVLAKDDEYGVFPFTQYYVQNIEVPMTLHAGAAENGYFVAIISGIRQGAAVPFIGTANTMFVIKTGYVVKDYLEGTGRLDIKLCGDVSVSPVSISTPGGILGIGKLTVASEKYALPITNNMNVTMESGTTTLEQNIALLPG